MDLHFRADATPKQLAEDLLHTPLFYIRLLGILCTVVVFGCVADKVQFETDILFDANCGYNNSNFACNFAIGVGVTSFLFCLAFLVKDVLLVIIDYSDNLRIKKFLIIVDAVVNGLWILAWFVCFSYTADQLRKHLVNSGSSTGCARAGVAFSFLSFLVWIAILVANIVLFVRISKGTDRDCRDGAETYDYAPLPKPITSKQEGREFIDTRGERSSMSTVSPLPKRDTSSARRSVCGYSKICTKYIESLEIHGFYLDSNFNKCFCEDCCESRREKNTFYAGQPRKRASIPRGYMKFGIVIRDPAQATVEEIFHNWHVTYHGTSPENVKKIIAAGELLMPGDLAPDNTMIAQPPGHFTTTRHPKNFDVNQIFFSPSIKYASDDVYAKPEVFTDFNDGQQYNVKTVFQVRVRPESYKVGPQTISTDAATIDNEFSNDELEWSTKMRKVSIMYGVLIKLDVVN